MNFYQGDRTAALNDLPDYSAEPEQAKATGTMDANTNKGENVLADCLAIQGGKQGHSGIRGGQTIASAQGKENPHQMQETLVYQGIPRGGDRTHDQGIMSPRL